MAESPQREEARKDVDRAIKEFARVRAEEEGMGPDAYVTGWVAFAEYLTTDIQNQDASGNCVIVPDDQLGATSRGLFEFGSDAFRR